MEASILRLDWYSFLIGTQVSAVTTLLTPTPYRMAGRLRPAREYLHPAVHNGGQTIFYFRIKDPGNIANYATKVLIRVLERNIVGGALYMMSENYFDTRNAPLAGAFLHGAVLGGGMSWRYNFSSNFWDSFLSGISAGQVVACGEEMRHMLLATKEVTLDDFIAPVPYVPISFWNGAITGVVLGLNFTNVSDYFEMIMYPDVDETDTITEKLVAYVVFVEDIVGAILRFSLFLTEKMIIGGVMFCGVETILRQVTGLKRPILIVAVCGSALGLYTGFCAGLTYPYPIKKVKKAWKLALITSAISYGWLMTVLKLRKFMEVNA